jgi:hypothetical protein
MVFNGTFAGSHDCGTLVDMATLLNANGDVVSAMLITEFRKEEVAFKHVDYIICRRKFYQTKAAFLLRNVFIGSCLNTILALFLTIM